MVELAVGGPAGGAEDTAELLADLAEHLAGELRLRPLLERVLGAALELLGCRDGSVSLLEAGGATYRKEAEIGVLCHVGRTFPVSEGMTGAVLRAGEPVVVEEYSSVSGGHLHAVDRARLHAAVGVPVLRGSGPTAAPLGALVVFSDDPARRFTRADADLLALFARHAATALTAARLHAAVAERDRTSAVAREREAAAVRAAERVGHHLAAVVEHLGHGDVESARSAARTALAASRAAGAPMPAAPVERPEALEQALRDEVTWAREAIGAQVRLVVAGPPQPVDPEVADHLLRALRVAVLRLSVGSGAGSLRAGLVHGGDGATLLVEDDGGAAADPDPDLVELVRSTRRLGGEGEVSATAGWGTHLRLRLPHQLVDSARSRESAAGRTGVLVVEAAPVLRAGLVSLLSAPGTGVRVVGEVAAAAEAVATAALVRPHAVLLGAPAGAAVSVVAEELRRAQPTTPVVLLSSLPADVGGPELTAALERAVVAAAAGALTPADAGLVAPADPTTPREREVLALLERGWSDRQIAEELVITRKTVEKHVGALLRKHGVPSRTALMAARLH